MRRNILRKAWPGLVLLAIAASAWAADIPRLEAQLPEWQTQQEALETERQTLLEQAEELASQIAALKRDAADGLGTSDRKLTRRLQESVELSQSIAALDRRINELSDRIGVAREELKDAYEVGIAALVRQMEQAEGPAKEGLTRRAMTYLSAKLKLEGSVTFSSEALLMDQIEIGPEDSAEDIREKADLVSDVADRLKAQLAQVDGRLSDLKRQQSMRRKMRQFAEEISFFDENVGVGRTVHPQESGAAEPTAEAEGFRETALDESAVDVRPGGEWKSESQPAAAPLLAAEYATTPHRPESEEVPWGGLEGEIDSLTVMRERLKEASAALSKKAEAFYRKAKTLE